jgi:NADH:ubiquinone oxidoreductase subunit E
MDFSVVDSIIEETGRRPEANIAILQKLQAHFGYLSPEALEYICEHTEITPAQIYGAATFYAQFRLEPVGKHIICVCHGTACHVAGARSVSEAVCGELGIQEGGTTKDRMFTLENVACVGCCALAPVMTIDNKAYGRLTRRAVAKALRDCSGKPAERDAG